MTIFHAEQKLLNSRFREIKCVAAQWRILMFRRKIFCQEVIKRSPDFEFFDGCFFYEKTVGRILSGFWCEFPPNGAYIWTYYIPLYVPFPFLHLTYGDRLPGPDGSMDRTLFPSSKALAAEFVKRIMPYRAEVSKRGNLNDFILYLEESGKYSSHYAVKMGYAASLILDGREGEANRHLTDIVNMKGIKLNGNVSFDAASLLEDLSIGRSRALERLRNWEIENRGKLGLAQIPESF